MITIVVTLASPLTEGRGEIFPVTGAAVAPAPLPSRAPDRTLLERIGDAVDAGCERAILDLTAATGITTDEVTWLTSFVWSVLTEGAQPVLVIPAREVVNAVQYVKMDRTFPIFDTLDGALAADRA